MFVESILITNNNIIGIMPTVKTLEKRNIDEPMFTILQSKYCEINM